MQQCGSWLSGQLRAVPIIHDASHHHKKTVVVFMGEVQLQEPSNPACVGPRALLCRCFAARFSSLCLQSCTNHRHRGRQGSELPKQGSAQQASACRAQPTTAARPTSYAPLLQWLLLAYTSKVAFGKQSMYKTKTSQERFVNQRWAIHNFTFL